MRRGEDSEKVETHYYDEELNEARDGWGIQHTSGRCRFRAKYLSEKDPTQLLRPFGCLKAATNYSDVVSIPT